MKAIKKHIVLTLVAAVLIVAVSFFIYLESSGKPFREYYTVGRADLSEQVSVSGTVKAAQNVDLAFEKGGIVSYVPADVGSRVSKGQVLASLNDADLLAQLDQATANVQAQEAKLSEMKQGARPEDVALAASNLAAAKTSLEEAGKGVASSVRDSYTASDDAVRNMTDPLFNNPLSDYPKFSPVIPDSQLVNNLNSDRVNIRNIMNLWGPLAAEGSSGFDAGSQIALAEKMPVIKSFLDECAEAVNLLASSPSNVSQAQIDAYKLNVSTARTEVDGASTALLGAESAYDNASSGVSVAQDQLTLEQVGGTPNQITEQQSAVDQADAAVKNLQVSIGETSIYSPIDGVVTRQDAKVGEIAPSGVPVVSVISSSKFQIETYVSEADIGKIKLGDTAEVALDAYAGESPVPAAVVAVDPAETSMNGVPSYKTTLQFSNDDARIKSGLTATLKILTNSAENTVAVPRLDVITKGSDKFVLAVNSGGDEELVSVVTGIEDPGGLVQILSGLSGGEKIISFGSAGQ